MKDESDGRRLGKRYLRGLDVEVHTKRGGALARAKDVSRNGLFLAMRDPPPEHQTVLLTVHLPDGPFETMAIVARSIRGAGAEDGAGVKLYLLASDAKVRWDRFLKALAARVDGAPVAPAPEPRPPVDAPLLWQPRKSFTEYALYSARVARAESPALGSDPQRAAPSAEEEPAELVTIQGELVSVEAGLATVEGDELEPVDRRALFDFDWRNDE